MYRKWGTAFVAGALLVSSSATAFAGTEAQQKPQVQQSALMPGGPAGVQKAQWIHAPVWIWVAGVGFVALGAGLVASGGSHHNTPSTSTTGTNL